MSADAAKLPEPRILCGGAVVVFFDRVEGRLCTRALVECNDRVIANGYDLVHVLVGLLATEHERVRRPSKAAGTKR